MRRSAPSMLLVLMTDVPSVSVGEKSQRLLPIAQIRGVHVHRRRLLGTDWRIERHEAARVDGIERHVAAIGDLGELLQCGTRDRACASAIRSASHCTRGDPWSCDASDGVGRGGRSSTSPGPRSPLPCEAPCELCIRPIEEPSFRHREHRLALLADASQVHHQIFERIERQLLAAARLHLRRDVRRLVERVG